METMPEVPLDIIYNNILPRLLAESLIRFKCVSKQWHTFLKSRFFANMHLNCVTNVDHQKHHKFLKISREGPFEFSTIDCETLEVGASRPFPFKVGFGQIRIESSCNGLVFLLLMNDGNVSELILWNPLTNDYKILVKTDISKKVYNLWGKVFELYYSSCDEDYKLVCVAYMRHDVFIYSLKTDSWRRVNRNNSCQYIPNLISSGVLRSTCLNENLYFLEWSYNNEYLIKFDTKIEKFTKIATPFIGNHIWSGPMVQGGCIYVYVKNDFHNTPIELWMMKRDGDWMMVLTYKDELYDKNPFLQPLHLMKDGTWLMKSRHTGALYKVKKDKGETCKDTLNGIEEVRYIPTFLSPNQYMS